LQKSVVSEVFLSAVIVGERAVELLKSLQALIKNLRREMREQYPKGTSNTPT